MSYESSLRFSRYSFLATHFTSFISEETMTSTITLKDGCTLAYAEYGNPKGGPVFFFHGVPGSRLFHPPNEVTSRLGMRLITIDRPGCGLSTYQPNRRIPDWPRDVSALADYLGIESFHVVGHSGGGPYTLACAWALPERVRGAAVVCGAGPADVETMKNMTPLNRLAFSIGGITPWPLWRIIAWYLYRMGRDNPAYLFERGAKDRAPADTEVLKWPGVLEENYASQSESLRQGTRGFALEARLLVRPWGFRLENIRVPVHIWHGTEDVDTPVSMGKAVAARIPNSRLTICPGEAHMLIYPHWEEILTTLIQP
jgi:pimeloyl-ACP methyl ester carboxylesterase